MGTPTDCPFADTHKEMAHILHRGCASIAPVLLTFPCTISLLPLPPSAPTRLPKDTPGHGDPFVPRPKGAASSEHPSVPPPRGSPEGSTAQSPSPPQTQPRRSQRCDPTSPLHAGPEQRAATGPRSSTARLRATRQRHKSQRGHVTVPRASRAMRAGEDCGRSLHRELFVIGDGQAATREGPPVPDNQPRPVQPVRSRSRSRSHSRSRSPLPSQPGCSQRGRSGIAQQRATFTRVSAPRAAEITSQRQLTAGLTRRPLPHEPSITPGTIRSRCYRRRAAPRPAPAPHLAAAPAGRPRSFGRAVT